MKKYNLTKIMKRAWEIKKENNENLFAMCLKLAWEEAKMEEKQIIKVNELPKLVGTEKQVAWAMSIREKFFEKVNEYFKEEQRYIETKEGMARKNRMRKFEKVVDVCNYLFKEKETAKWWIENRHIELHSICSFAWYGDCDKVRLTAQEIIEKYK